MKKFKKICFSILAVSTMFFSMNCISINANDLEGEPVWQDTMVSNSSTYQSNSNSNSIATASSSYFTWINKGTNVVYGYKNSKLIGKQNLTSYRWENLSDQIRVKASVVNYTYNSSTNNYTYGWTSSNQCYCRARVESATGSVYADSQRKYAQYSTYAETSEPVIGIAKTYCGNTAAD